jgi:hypothetical protein
LHDHQRPESYQAIQPQHVAEAKEIVIHRNYQVNLIAAADAVVPMDIDIIKESAAENAQAQSLAKITATMNLIQNRCKQPTWYHRKPRRGMPYKPRMMLIKN